MTEKDAADLIEMIESNWSRYYAKASKDMILDFLLPLDAELMTKTVVRLAQTQQGIPSIFDLRDMYGAITGERGLPEGECPTCHGDKMVLVYTQEPPYGEAYAACPDCNSAADGSFRRFDGSTFTPMDPERVRVRMRQ